MTSTLKGIFPSPKPQCKKNYIHENVKNLRKMEQCFHVKRDSDDIQNFCLTQKTDKYGKTVAKINTNLRETKRRDIESKDPEKKEEKHSQHLQQKISAPVLDRASISSTKRPVRISNKNDCLKIKGHSRINSKKGGKVSQQKVSSDSNLEKNKSKVAENYQNVPPAVVYKHQGIQTLDECNLSSIYADGVIRYPTKRNGKNEKNSKNEMGQNVEENGKHQLQSLPLDRGDNRVPDAKNRRDSLHSESPPSPDGTDYVKLNKQRVYVAGKTTAQSNNGLPPANYQKGVVPKYLKERKEAYEKEQKEKAASFDPDCPEGHVPLPDDERKETLRMLKKNYQDYVKELNMMPIKSDTLRAQRRKMELEKQLTKLEEGIKVFSKPKVFVKIHA